MVGPCQRGPGVVQDVVYLGVPPFVTRRTGAEVIETTPAPLEMGDAQGVCLANRLGGADGVLADRLQDAIARRCSGLQRRQVPVDQASQRVEDSRG